MFQIQNIKLNDSISSIGDREEPADSTNNFNGRTTSVSQHTTDDGQTNNVRSSNTSLTDELMVDSVSEKPSQSCDNFGDLVTPDREMNNSERTNIDSSVVTMHFVNRNYRSHSDSTGLSWCDSAASIESNEFDRRFYETKQWQSNLFYYNRPDAVIDLNHRVQLKFQPLKPLIIGKPLPMS